MALAAATLNRFATRLCGTVLRPGDPGYDTVRKPVIGTPREVLPLAVVRCGSVSDVVEALGFVRSHRLRFALRSGGNSFAEHSTTDGLLIDLGGMSTMDLVGDQVTVGPGARLGVLATQLAASERMVPCGWCACVGVAGATLGGGYGVFSRRYGLGCDHLVSAEVVSADGRVVWADADREPDLYWALRGAGGGNFGAVTSLVLRTRPVVAATRFDCHFPHRDAVSVVDAWQRWAPDLDPEVNAELALVAGDDPVVPPLVVLFGVAMTGRAGTLRLLEQFTARAGVTPGRVNVAEMSGREAAQHNVDPGQEPSPPVPGTRPGYRVVKSEFFHRSLPTGAIVDLVGRFAADRTAGEYRDLEFVPWGGAFAKVAPEATAFAHRTARFLVKHTVQVGARASDRRRAEARRWVTRSWHTVHPWGTGGVYVNYPDPDLPDWARAYHGRNLERLSELKARYDPDRVFQFPQAIPPPADG